MIFGPASLAEARGAIMAHSQRVGERMIRKGSLLDDAAITQSIRSKLSWNAHTEDLDVRVARKK